MANGKKNKESKKDTNAWMTTYTDLMILLLTFFVLLLSMSIVTDEKKLVALNSLTGAFGFKPGGHSIIGSLKGVNITMGAAPMKEEVVDFERMRNLIIKNALDPNVNVIKDLQRTVIRLDDRVLFERASSEIKAEYTTFLGDLGEIIKGSLHSIELRGFCAPSETAFDDQPFKTSMILSTKRAFAVLEFFREKSEIPAERMVAHGFGSNASRKGSIREKNELGRQVEIILDYRTPVPHRLKRSKRDPLLDFKGFLFRFPRDENE